MNNFRELYYLSAKEVAQRYSIGISTVWDWTSKKLLPAPVHYGQRCTRWSSVDLDKHDRDAKGEPEQWKNCQPVRSTSERGGRHDG